MIRRLSRLVFYLSALIVPLSSPSRAELPGYLGFRLLDSDTLFFDQASGSWFSHINNSHQIFTSGSSSIPANFNRLWDNGAATAYSWDANAFDFVSRGQKINEHGEMAGMLSYTDDRLHQHGYVTINKVVTELPPLDAAHFLNPNLGDQPTCGQAWAYDVNENGDVSGWSAKFENDILKYRAVIWQNGIPSEFPAVTGFDPDSMSFDQVYINNSGQIAGNFKTTNFDLKNIRRGFYSDGGALKEIVPFTSMPILTGGVDAMVFDLNDSGQVVGYARINVSGTETRHAFVFDIATGTLKDIHSTHFSGTPSVGSQAVAINNKGQVAGFYTSGGAALVAFLYDPVDDSTYLVNDLFTDFVWHDELGSQTRPSVEIVYDINDDGALLGKHYVNGLPRMALYAPTQGNLVVNSEDDDDDLVPGDGNCFTGQHNELGYEECTLRAALQEVNALSGRDTIRFNIPSGQPSITLANPLPGVTEEVVIDCLTQPNTRRVGVSGELLGSGSGLTISAGNSEIYGLLLNNFPAYGLVLSANGNNIVESSHFGTDITGTLDWGNGSGGIFINNSSGNRIGDQVIFEEGNRIAFNGGPGVLVGSGTANLIARNYIYENDGLGIDLDPIGVNPNDTLDADVGPNTLLNYPYIDSVVSGQLYGTLYGAPNDAYIVELYRSDFRDPSGYGEGQEPLLTSLVNTDADGVVQFDMSTGGEALTGNQVFTLLSHDNDNTSEFSPCWPGKVQLIDGNNHPIASTTFALYKVAFDPPAMTETFVDSVTTDVDGFLPGDISGVAPGDSVKFAILVDSTMSGKRDAILPVLNRIYLDNAKIDSITTTVLYYDEFPSNTGLTKIKLNHTTLAYNLLVSVEWDADPAYADRLVTGLYRMNNYLYDVFDGQVRIDTVQIHDRKVGWNECDIRIFASNIEWPKATPLGALVDIPDATVKLPPVWYGTDSTGRNQSPDHIPPDPSPPLTYRTIGHELGHYLIGFLDEYRFVGGGQHCEGGNHRYGFMESQYASAEPTASEMSSSYMYSIAACRNTEQWAPKERSCWDHFGAMVAEATTGNSVLTPILRPEDRRLPVGATILSGPNASRINFDYDVGNLAAYLRSISPPVYPTKKVHITAGGIPLKAISVTTVARDGSAKAMYHGKTSDSGYIAVLGHSYAYNMFAGGRELRIDGAATAETWYYGVDSVIGTSSAGLFSSATAPLVDSAYNLELSPIAGDYPLVVDGRLDASGRIIRLNSLNQFLSEPSLDVTDTGGVTLNVPFSLNGNQYSASATGDLSSEGILFVSALDDSSDVFRFDLQYVKAALSDTLGLRKALSSDGALEFTLDTGAFTFDSALIVTSSYPVLRGGLTEVNHQVSDAYSVSLFPDGPLTGEVCLAIRYDRDLVDTTANPDAEKSIRIFRWSESSPQWTLIPGVSDTVFHEVSAVVSEQGVFAAFTTELQVDADDDDLGEVLPYRFELSQNRPNPFNPVTTIEYSLARRSHVSIEVYNILGQKVRSLVDREEAAGAYSITWDGKNSSGKQVATGVYLYRFEAGAYIETKKMLLMK